MKIKYFITSALFLAVSASDGKLISHAYGENTNKAAANDNSSTTMQEKKTIVEDNFSFDSGTCLDVEGLSIDNKTPNSTKTDSNGCE